MPKGRGSKKKKPVQPAKRPEQTPEEKEKEKWDQEAIAIFVLNLNREGITISDNPVPGVAAGFLRGLVDRSLFVEAIGNEEGVVFALREPLNIRAEGKDELRELVKKQSDGPKFFDGDERRMRAWLAEKLGTLDLCFAAKIKFNPKDPSGFDECGKKVKLFIEVYLEVWKVLLEKSRLK